MPKINQLSFEVANLIAAGEVVERPASVVKELLENAIDAGASEITAEIRHGGVSLIRITDNGVGMEAEDLPIAIRRHATSKIKNADDLAAIGTLGFRGEALAAISAVSDITIISKTKTSPTGMMLVAHAGAVEEISEVGVADGTSVLVENLFGNVPARRKFLKKDSTEAQAVAAVLEKIAMSRPDIAFTFLSDGIRKFATPGDGVLLHTLHALFGRDFASRLLAVEGRVSEVTVTGFIGKPDNAKSNRNHQNVFINGRYVRSKTVGAAIERAYTSYMAPERFPVAVLFLDIPSFAVDVNVHPAKLEVKFSDERTVFEAVYYAIRTALENDTSRPYFEMAKGTSAQKRQELAHTFGQNEKTEQVRITPPLRPEAPSAPLKTPTPPTPPTPPASSATAVRETPSLPKIPSAEAPKPLKAAASDETPKKSFLSPEDSLRILERMAEAEKSAPTEEKTIGKTLDEKAEPPKKEEPVPPRPEATMVGKLPHTEHKTPLPPYRIAGILFQCYIMVELEDGRALMIDQHAAHERILFEEMKRQRAGSPIVSAELLLPLSVTLTPEETAAAEEGRESLASLGFTYEIKGRTAYLTAIPADLTPPEAEKIFVTLLDETDPAVSEEMRREKLLYQLACKAAIKGGRSYDDTHVDWLVREVLSIPDVTVCPHGRPIAFYLTKSELDRRFDRLK